MKGWLIKFLLLFITFQAESHPYFDSLHRQLQIANDDKARVLALCALAQYHEFVQTDSNIFYVRKAIDLSDKIDFPLGKFWANRSLFYATNFTADYTKTLEIAFSTLKFAQEIKDEKDRLYRIALTRLDFALVRLEMGDTLNSQLENRLAEESQKKSGKLDGDFWATNSFRALPHINFRPDSALYYAQKGYEMSLVAPTRRTFACLAAAVVANRYEQMKNYIMARKFYEQAIVLSEAYNNLYIKARVYRDLARFFAKTGNTDSCIYYAGLAIPICSENNFGDYASAVTALLAKVYEARNEKDSALKYMKLTQAAKDTIFNQAKMQKFQLLISENEQREREIIARNEKFQNRVKLVALISVAGVFLLLAGILYRNNRQKQKTNARLQEQKEKIQQTLVELQSAQAQLVQSEKMASLGELTAGIAHEIQNPLNFVNNFSEVNSELLTELKKEIDTGNFPEVKTIAGELELNMEKIAHHGKRADNIVKGMLQHSRTSTGQKELTDINSLCDEYLRLSYHASQAGQASPNVTLKTDFDPSAGEINIIPQEIGRLLLNLYNNAFYAVAEKKKLVNDFNPEISVATRRNGNKIEVIVKDNGTGIPENVKDKIFQPFFTTKPTGHGTGLGLSMSYDIVKAHGAEIKVESKVSEGTTFTVSLPG